MKKVLSVILTAVLLCLSVCVVSFDAEEATEDQKNIAGWADYYYDITWTALKTIDGWHSSSSSYTLKKGTTYHIPYAQPINSGKYIVFGVSVDDFLAAANDVNSVFYTKTSSYGDTYSTYYGMDCSAFVSACWGTARKTTYYIPTISENLGSPDANNIDQLRLGDALNSRSVGHVVLVTDIEYADGRVSKVEITEETPPQLKRTVYTRAELILKYSEKYTIQRYAGSVPAPPDGYAPEPPTEEPTQPPVSTQAPRYLGDADGDGDITILDVTTIQRSLVSIPVAYFDEDAADVDADGETTIIDATFIQRKMAGITVPYRIGESV